MTLLRYEQIRQNQGAQNISNTLPARSQNSQVGFE